MAMKLIAELNIQSRVGDSDAQRRCFGFGKYFFLIFYFTLK